MMDVETGLAVGVYRDGLDILMKDYLRCCQPVKISAKIGAATQESENPDILTIHYDTNSWEQVTAGIYRSKAVVAAGDELDFLLKTGDNQGIVFDAETNYHEGAYVSGGDGDYMAKSIIVTFQTAAVQGDVAASVADTLYQFPAKS